MPIRLTTKDWRLIALTVLVSGVSLAVSLKYFERAFPEASIEFRVNRTDSEPIARQFLLARGFRVEGYKHAAIFAFSDDTRLYLERTQGLARTNELARGPIRLWRWSHRWFKPQQKEEVRVDVTPAGEIAGFERATPETAPGANLSASSARALAEAFLREVLRRELSELEFVETKIEKRPARTDHSFTWKHKNVDLGDGSLRVEVEVAGDQVATYREYVKVPEHWTRDYETLRSRNVAAQLVDEVFWALLTVAMLIVLIRRLLDRDVRFRFSLGFGLVAAALYFLGQLNTFALEEFSYRTTDSYSSFVANYVTTSVLSALALGTVICLLVASSEPVYREAFPHLVSLRQYFTRQGLRTRSFFMANVLGIGLTFFFFAYQTVFYLAAEKLGAWAPADIPFSNELNTRIPWVGVLFTGFFPAVSEEMQFRAFALPFLKKLTRSWPLALVLAAFNWGFLHAAYPNQPFFIRGVEVGLGGIVIGLVMLRFGILAPLIWHYSVDAFYTAFLLLRSENHYLQVSGALTAGIMLVPLLVAGIAYWRARTFAAEEGLTNGAEGISRLERPEAPATAEEVQLAYTSMSRRRLALAGVLVAVFGALAFLQVERFGEGIKVWSARRDAIRAANSFLEKQGVDQAGHRRAAWLHENIDPLALRYLLEHRPVKATDQIYRQATRLLLWEVRYFKPLEKEEHLVFVDATDGTVFAYRHLLDENAPGASLSASQARALSEKSVRDRGYQLDDFELESFEEQKRKARTDYVFTWQAKSDDSRNVGEARYRLQANVAGDQVVGFVRYFKIPEEWQRQRTATRLPNAILKGLGYLLMAGLAGGGVLLFVRQLRRGQIAWRPSAKVGAVLGLAVLLRELNQLPLIYRQYETSTPLNTFRLSLASGFAIFPLLVGLAGWVLVGLATSLYPQAWLVFRRSARRVWRRDAAVAVFVSLAAAAAVSHLRLLLAGRLHAYAPVTVDLAPSAFDSFLPGVGFFLRALLWTVFGVALAALLVHAVRQGLRRRAWWFWLGAPLLLVALGPESAHSLPEFLAGWATSFIALPFVAVVVGFFFRDNVLAYVGAGFCLQVAEPLVRLFSQPAAFYRWNGVLLAILAAVFLAWLMAGRTFRAVGGQEPSAA